MVQTRPTKEAQDEYFRQTNPNPWGDDNPYVVERLGKSLRFVQNFIAQDYSGVFVEVGAFNGDFTRRLASAFPKSKIAASDLVLVAWEMASAVQAFPPSVNFEWTDMMDYRLPEKYADHPAVILLMECLYYLPKADRTEAVSRLLQRVPNAEFVFISAPTDGSAHYFSEEHLLKMMQGFGLSLSASERLNAINPPSHSLWRRLYLKLSGQIVRPGQAIYCFNR